MKPICTNPSGKVLAYENDVSEYRKEIRDRSNALLGWYNPHQDKTFDRSGRSIGSGDQRGRSIRDD
jgi:hypothetical protein